MSTEARAGLALVALAFAAALFFLLGAAETLALVFGIALLAGTAWLGPRAVRITGAACLAIVGFGVGRATLSPAFGVVLAVVAATAGARYAPLRVLRRVTFLVPSLVLLVFVTTLLMYHAPGNPFAGERSVNPQVEAALRAHFGVPKSATEFFGIYMQRLVVEGSLGPSIKVQGRTVEGLLAPAP